MNMQRRRFVVGIVAGLLFALAIIASASYALNNQAASSPVNGETVVSSYIVASSTVTTTIAPVNGTPAPPASVLSTTETGSAMAVAPNQTITYTSSTSTTSSYAPASTVTTIVVTNTITSAETLPPSIMGSLSNALGGLSRAPTSAQEAASASSPSSITRILGQPVESAVLLIPVLVALILGLVLYRASTVRE